MRIIIAISLMLLSLNINASAQDNDRIAALKAEVSKNIDDNKKMSQEIIDSLFSFSELGFQEYETQNYCQ